LQPSAAMNDSRIWSAFALLLCTLSCGVPIGSGSSQDGSPRWQGSLTLGTQCPYGMVSDTRQGSLKLAGCPLPLDALEILETPGPILFSGDCREKILAIRTGDLSLDSLWQVMPNDTFDLGAGPIWIRLSQDQDGHQNCWARSRIIVKGALQCRDQDRMDIRLDEITLSLADESSSSGEIGPDGQRCHLPTSCRLTGSTLLGQCQ
jgi:hypothetical protein